MTDTGKTSELDRARPKLKYEDVSGLLAGPTQTEEALASIAQSLKRIADTFARSEPSRASAGGGEPFTYTKGFGPGDPDCLAARPDPSPAQAPETGEKAEAVQFAHLRLDEPYEDPDSDVSVLARQFLRTDEALRTASARIRELEGERDCAVTQANHWQTSALSAEAALADLKERVRKVVALLVSFSDTREIEQALAFLTDPSPTSKGGGSDLNATNNSRTIDQSDPHGTGPANIAQPARDTDTPAPAPPFGFDRYINGRLMAEGVVISNEPTLERATLAAVKIAPREPGQALVLVYRGSFPAPAPDMSGVARLSEVRRRIVLNYPAVGIVEFIDAALSSLRSADAKGGQGDG